MEHSNLSSLISALERGTNLHISITFLENYGNRMTHCTQSQVIHGCPVCADTKKTQQGLIACYRCRMTVQRAVIRRRKPMGGYCTKGVYEYCRPVIYDDKVVAVIFVGNVLTDDPAQRQRLEKYVAPELLHTMERKFSPADCAHTADIVGSYIGFLLDRYGFGTQDYDPLLENVKNFLRENIAYDLSMEDLANVFGYNKKYLGRLFFLREGCTIREFCNSIKVKKAKQLLEDTDLSIAEVANQVGFNYVTYFDRVFTQHTKLSPRAYRVAIKSRK